MLKTPRKSMFHVWTFCKASFAHLQRGHSLKTEAERFDTEHKEDKTNWEQGEETHCGAQMYVCMCIT